MNSGRTCSAMDRCKEDEAVEQNYLTFLTYTYEAADASKTRRFNVYGTGKRECYVETPVDDALLLKAHSSAVNEDGAPSPQNNGPVYADAASSVRADASAPAPARLNDETHAPPTPAQPPPPGLNAEARVTAWVVLVLQLISASLFAGTYWMLYGKKDSKCDLAS